MRYEVRRNYKPVHVAQSLREAILYVEGELKSLRSQGYVTEGNWSRGWVAIPREGYYMTRDSDAIRFDLAQVRTDGKWQSA